MKNKTQATGTARVVEGGGRPTREIDKFDEAPLFRAGRVVLSAGFFHLYFFFFFLLLTKDEAPLCTIKSLMSEDVADGGRVGREGGSR